MVTVRPATLDDLEYVTDAACRFAAHVPYCTRIVEADVREAARAMIEEAFVTVAVDNSTLVGVSGACQTRAPWDKNQPVLQEVMLWVDEGARNGRAGLLLLRALEALAVGLGAVFIMVREADSALYSLERRGYRALESSYWKQ